MFGLAKHLESLGCDVTVYDCQRSLKQKLLRRFSYHPRRQLRKLKLAAEYARDRQGIQLSPYNGEELDLAVLGSDEIWNLENASFENAPEYVGEGIAAQRIIAYAPSCGYADPAKLLKDPSFASSLRKLDEIFPRDRQTRKLAETITGASLSEVADPTILFDSWASFTSTRFDGSGEYLVYYGYTGQPIFKAALQKYASDRGLPIYTAGYREHAWCDENLAIGPSDFLSLIKNAKGVLTDTFHGLVMAVLLGKPICFGAPSQKVRDFAEKAGMLDLALSKYCTEDDLVKCFEQDISSRRVRVEALRDRARDLLRGAILT